MASEAQVLKVLNLLGEMLACPMDGTRLRYGDFECPHCGNGLDDYLHRFAELVVDAVTDDGA